MHVRLIEWLLDSRVGNPGNVLDSFEQRIRIGLIARQIIAGYLNVDRSGQPEVQNLADHVGGQERKRHAGKLFGQADTQVMNVLSRFMVIDRESYENIGIRRAHCSRVVVGDVDAAVCKPDIVDHIGDFAWGQLLSDGLLNEIAEARGFLNARASWRSEVKVERAAVDGREEVFPQPGNDQS